MAVHIATRHIRRSLFPGTEKSFSVLLTYGGAPYKLYIYSGSQCVGMLKDKLKGRYLKVYDDDLKQSSEIPVAPPENFSQDVYASTAILGGNQYKVYLYNLLKDKTSYYVLHGSFMPGNTISIKRY